MPSWFYDLNVIVALLLIYAVFGVIGFIAYKLNIRYIKEINESSLIYQARQTSINFGTILIAFWIALNWQSLSNLKLASKAEGQAILNLYSQTHLIKEPDATEIRQVIKAYLNSVINEGYKSLEQGEINQNTKAIFEQLKLDIYNLPVSNLEQQQVYYHITQSLNTLIACRVKRLDYLQGQMNGILLAFLFLLLVNICVWSACVYNRNRVVTVVVLMSQYMVLLSSLWLILELDRPFQGYFKVDNSAFVQVQSEIKQLEYLKVNS